MPSVYRLEPPFLRTIFNSSLEILWVLLAGAERIYLTFSSHTRLEMEWHHLHGKSLNDTFQFLFPISFNTLVAVRKRSCGEQAAFQSLFVLIHVTMVGF